MTKNKLEEQFLDLLNQCHGTILKLCLLHTDRQPDNVDDLYQEIVYNLWASFPHFRGECKPSTWACRIALNTVYMQHRQRRRMPQFIMLGDYVFENLANPEGNPMLERLYHLIDQLDAEEKTLVFMYLDKMPLREIAATLETTETAVKHKINRLKKKLKKLNERE